MPPSLTLHALPPSHPSLTADVALRLKGLEFERVDLQPGEHNEEILLELGYDPIAIGDLRAGGALIEPSRGFATG